MAAPTAVNSGTQTATISTIHTLVTQTSAGIYVLQVLLNNMADGDTATLAIQVRTTAGGTWYQAYAATFIGAQPDPMKYSIPVPVDVAIQCTLKQSTCTGRQFPWKLLSM